MTLIPYFPVCEAVGVRWKTKWVKCMMLKLREVSWQTINRLLYPNSDSFCVIASIHCHWSWRSLHSWICKDLEQPNTVWVFPLFLICIHSFACVDSWRVTLKLERMESPIRVMESLSHNWTNQSPRLWCYLVLPRITTFLWNITCEYFCLTISMTLIFRVLVACLFFMKS